VEAYDDYVDREREYTDREIKEREVYLKKEYNYKNQTIKTNPAPSSSRKDYTSLDEPMTIDQARSYETQLREQRKQQAENKGSYIRKDKFGNITETSKNLSQFQGQNLKDLPKLNVDFDGDGDKEMVSVEKVLSKAPHLADKVQEYKNAYDASKVPDENYYSTAYKMPSVFSRVDINQRVLRPDDPNRFAYNAQGHLIDRYKQQSVEPDSPINNEIIKKVETLPFEEITRTQVEKDAIKYANEVQDMIDKGELSKYYDPKQDYSYTHVNELAEDANIWKKANYYISKYTTSKVLPSPEYIIAKAKQDYDEIKQHISRDPKNGS